MPDPRSLGRIAEDQAAAFLADLGYVILARRFKSRRGEIDVIALDGQVLVCVEVKYSATSKEPEHRITDDKIRRMGLAAREFLAKMEFEPAEIRFDAVLITAQGIDHRPASLWRDALDDD